MGRGPDSHVVRKLTRKYFKFDLKRNNFNSATVFYPELMSAWSKDGMNSPQAKLIQQKIDLATEQDEKEFREIKKLTKNLPRELNQMLPKVKTKYMQKGRNPQQHYTYDEPTEKSLAEIDAQWGLK